MQELNKNYVSIISDLKTKIRLAQTRISHTANSQLLQLYWEIGNTILEQQNHEGWGTKVIDRLSTDLKIEFPEMKGLSVRNIKYMRAFAEAYPNVEIAQPSFTKLQLPNNESDTFVQASPAQLEKRRILQQKAIMQVKLAQISWYHHTTLLDKFDDYKTRVFYIEKTIQNRWSRDVMVLQINSKLHLRQGQAITNFDENFVFFFLNPLFKCQKKIIFTLLLGLLISLNSCDFVFWKKPKGVILINKSRQNIYYHYSINDSITKENNPLLIQTFEGENEKGVKFINKGIPNLVLPNDSTGVTRYFWPERNETITIFIFTEDLKNKTSWSEIVKKQLYSKKFIFNPKKAEEMGWKIIYN
jgi:predicted nuclease of restriction endonuclease-like (RecB) superfamily